MNNENNDGWGRNNPFANNKNPDTEGFPAQPGPKPPQYRSHQTPPVQVFVQQPPARKKGGAIALAVSAVLAVAALVGAGIFALTSGNGGDDELSADGSQETSTVVIGTTTLTRPPTAKPPRPTATNGTGNRSNGSGSSNSGSGSGNSGSSRSTNSRRTTTRNTPRNTTRNTPRNTPRDTPRNTPRNTDRGTMRPPVTTPPPAPEPEEPEYTPDLTTISCSSGVLVLASVDADSSSLKSSIEAAKSADSSAVVITSGSCSGLSDTYGSGSYLVVVDYGSDTSTLCSAAQAGSGTAVAAGDGSDPCVATEPAAETEPEEA
ncbi:hypothetical protein [Corynebacterium variabile]|uniref:hypothetical protein n=1 Tax=Corynebacterium variabile TaxID=1727 RepID=UPI003A93BCFE